VPPLVIPGIEWRQLSQLDSEPALREAVVGCDVVVHLAALAHQTGKAAAGRWAEFERVNVESTRLLAKTVRSLGTRRLVFVSSVAAVCSQSDVSVDEQSLPRPDSDYGRSKLDAEHRLQQELDGSGADWCILRPPLVYGPGNPGNMARLMGLIERGLPLPFASIRNRRSFIYIDNLVDALAIVICHPVQIRSTYFLNDGSDFSTPELTVALAAAAGRRIRLLPVPVGVLRLLGRLGDVLGPNTGLDSYSVDRLVGSMPVNGEGFRSAFSWHPPVGSAEAIRITGSSA
jgi:nucleoside-diphosphate-sugar epimerase